TPADPDPAPPLPAGTTLLTTVVGSPPRLVDGEPALRVALEAQPEFFQTMHAMDRLIAAHTELHFYTWGAEDCCLPRGATSATLRGDLTISLRVGDVLVFEELVGPRTGAAEDADPSHRQAVRLTR